MLANANRYTNDRYTSTSADCVYQLTFAYQVVYHSSAPQDKNLEIAHKTLAQTVSNPLFWFQQLTFGFIRVIWVKWADLESFAYHLCTSGKLWNFWQDWLGARRKLCTRSAHSTLA